MQILSSEEYAAYRDSGITRTGRETFPILLDVLNEIDTVDSIEPTLRRPRSQQDERTVRRLFIS